MPADASFSSFAERVLRAALAFAGPAPSAGSQRVAAGLVTLLAAEGADEQVARLLAVEPGEPATFDVDCTRDGVLERQSGMGLVMALRQASKLVQTGARKVSIIAVSHGGLRRRVLEWVGSGSFRYLHPSESSFEGDDSACIRAAQAWREWMDPVAGGEGPPAGPSTGARLPEQAERLDPANVVDAIRDALASISVEIDTAGVQSAVAGAVKEVLNPEIAGRLGEIAGKVNDMPGGWVTQATLIAAADELHVLLESFSDRVRAGSRALEELADELAARERSAADFTEQLAKSMHSSIDRLARHIDDRLDDLARGTRG